MRLFRRVWSAGGGELTTAALALLTVVLAQSRVPAVSVAVAGLVLLGLMLSIQGLGLNRRPIGAFRLARVLMLVAVGIKAIGTGHLSEWIALAVLGAVIAAEGLFSRLDTLAVPFAVNLPSLEIRTNKLIPVLVPFYVNCAALLVVGAVAFLDAPPVISFLVVAAAVVVWAVGLTDSVLRIRARARSEQRLNEVITDYAPRFAVHWDAAMGTGYQIGRWLPYLDRLGERYILVVRNPRSFPEAATLTDQPILLRRGATTLDQVMVQSLSCVFYVNNALRNVHMVRYPGIRHIQLNHGDSDKAPSYNPVSRMFDKNFVAGQAAIDRFAAHDVPTSPDFFEIVGRPQVEDVLIAAGPVRLDGPRVLYAPTWAGMHSDSAYSSLVIGPLMIRALIARGCSVVYRPHPYAGRTPELAAASAEIQTLIEQDARVNSRAHVWGPQAEVEWTITDCFNEVDAMISDVSSVVPDFLYSQKPFAICAMAGEVADFYEEMPIARAGYVIAADGSNIEPVLDDLLGPDPALAVRRQLRTYYLGDIPDEHYAEAFVTAARKVIGSPTSPGLTEDPGLTEQPGQGAD